MNTDTPLLEILYQDADCVVVNKPSGMLVHKSWLAKQETQFVMQTLRDQLGQYVYPVHRLDRPTSGALLFALNSEAARYFCQQFEEQQINKKYWAIVRGWLATDNSADSLAVSTADNGYSEISHTINYPLKVIYDKIADKHSLQEDKEQEAITDWRLIAQTEQPFQARARYATSRYSWLELTPKTGRKHQLRRHMKHIFHPIIGDTSYGDHHQNRAIRKHLDVSRLLLHAYQLSFINTADEKIDVFAGLDTEFVAVLEQFAWHEIYEHIIRRN